MTVPPLDGIRVVDFSELAVGPFLTQALAEMGATVVKIERPGGGDPARALSPGGFGALNRDKRSVELDLRSTAGRAQALDLIADADIVVEGFRPGAMRRLMLDYPAACAVRPAVIYVSLTGFGQTGPNTAQPGHDINYLAASGLLALSGGADHPVCDAIGVPIGDLIGGLHGLSAVLAALWQRHRTGLGQHIDVAIADCLTHALNARLGHFQTADLRTLAEQRAFVFNRPAYGVFTTADGESVAIAAMEGAFYHRLKDALDLDLSAVADLDAASRSAAAVAINAAIADTVGKRTKDDVLARLRAADVPVTEVASPMTLPQAEQYMARELFVAHNGNVFARHPVRLAGMASDKLDENGISQI